MSSISYLRRSDSVLLSFFFYCYVHHRDLHSFPTRRSSDLWWRWSTELAGPQARAAFTRAGVKGSARRRTPAALAMADRKSTRLNSSHVAISYAVFCLKKKKIEQVHANSGH